MNKRDRKIIRDRSSSDKAKSLIKKVQSLSEEKSKLLPFFGHSKKKALRSEIRGLKEELVKLLNNKE